MIETSRFRSSIRHILEALLSFHLSSTASYSSKYFFSTAAYVGLHTFLSLMPGSKSIILLSRDWTPSLASIQPFRLNWKRNLKGKSGCQWHQSSTVWLCCARLAQGWQLASCRSDCSLVPKGVRGGLPQIDTKQPTARRLQFAH